MTNPVGVTRPAGVIVKLDETGNLGIANLSHSGITGIPEVTPELTMTGNSYMLDFAAKPRYTQVKELWERRERRGTEVKAVEERRDTGREEETGETHMPIGVQEGRQ